MLAGGRYDGLTSTMFGKDVPAVGWAAGVDRLVMLQDDLLPAAAAPASNNRVIAVVSFSDGLAEESPELARLVRGAQQLVSSLRQAGHEVAWHHGRKLKKLMRSAAKDAPGKLLILGGDELAREELLVRSLDGEQPGQRTIRFPLGSPPSAELHSLLPAPAEWPPAF